MTPKSLIAICPKFATVNNFPVGSLWSRRQREETTTTGLLAVDSKSIKCQKTGL